MKGLRQSFTRFAAKLAASPISGREIDRLSGGGIEVVAATEDQTSGSALFEIGSEGDDGNELELFDAAAQWTQQPKAMLPTPNFKGEVGYSSSRDGPPILCILVVGFHHIQGPLIEYAYPAEHLKPQSSVSLYSPLNYFTKNIWRPRNSSPQQILDDIQAACRWVPFLALPDASHHTEADFVHFLLPAQSGRFIHGVSCYRRVQVDLLHHKDEAMTRTHVQKAVCILSQVPFWGALQFRLAPVTYAYFNQGDFRNTKMLDDLFDQLNANNFEFENSPYSDLFYNLETTPLILRFKPKQIVTLVKAILLECKIVIFSLSAAKASSTVLALVSLFPAVLNCNFTSVGLSSNHPRWRKFGFPLQIFNSRCALCPHLSLQLLDDILDKRGFLAGVTNRLLLGHPTLQPDIVVDLDEAGRLEFCRREIGTSLQLTDADNHTIRKRISSIARNLRQTSPRRPEDSKEDEEVKMRPPTVFKSLRKWRGGRSPSPQDGDDQSDVEGFDVPHTSQNWDGEDNPFCFDLSAPDALELSADSTVWAASMDAVRAEVSNYLESFLRWASFAAGPLRDVDELRGALDEKSFGLRDFGVDFGRRWSETTNCSAWLVDHGLPTLPRYTKPPKNGWAKFTYDNGDEYCGQFRSSLRHGQGVYTAKSGMRYDGQWEADQRHGEGTLIDELSGFMFSGMWRRDRKCGDGHLYSRGERYWGGFYNSKFQGKGTFVDRHGNQFVGEFRDGKFHGCGTLRKLNGEISIGEWQEGLLNGQGNRLYADGRNFAGTFKDGLPHGAGDMHYPDGSKYDGQWEFGHRHGDGLFSFSCGEKFLIIEGGWDKDGPRVGGDWVVTFSNGDKYSGQLKMSKEEDEGPRAVPHGRGLCKVAATGKTYDGQWYLGMRHGQGECIASDGCRYRGDWAFGLQHGAGSRVHHDGKVQIGFFRCGQLEMTEECRLTRALAVPLDSDSPPRLPPKPRPEDVSRDQYVRFKPFWDTPLDRSPFFFTNVVPTHMRANELSAEALQTARPAFPSSPRGSKGARTKILSTTGTLDGTPTALTPGSLDVTPGSLDVTPGSLDVSPGSLDVVSASLDIAPIDRPSVNSQTPQTLPLCPESPPQLFLDDSSSVDDPFEVKDFEICED